MRKFTILASLALTTLAAATPAAAVTTTFANFSATAGGANIRWVRTGNSAEFYTTTLNNGTAVGARNVNFSFLQASIAPFVTNVTASWTMQGTVTNTIATQTGITLNQTNLEGSFSFLTTQGITIGANFFAAGSNLLSGTFNNTVISGDRGGNSAGMNGSTPGAVISYTSDFLDFTATAQRNFALNLTSVNPVLNAVGNPVPTSAINSFRAVAGGSFSSDPAPVVTAVPEPGTWAMMIAGMGLVGFARRRRQIVIAA
jgi:hypothetical protein